MLPTPNPPVKPAWLCNLPLVIKEQATIWLLFGGGALVLWLTGADATIARLIYQPDLTLPSGQLAWFLRLYSSYPGALVTVLALVGMFWPGLWRTRPTLYQTAVVVALTTILGAGLVNQLVVKDIAGRARPRETVLYQLGPNPIGNTTVPDGFRGNSMPSGHAAMGFILCAPFFTLRRRKPRLAIAFLAGGLSFGTFIGMSRMMLGAHFATDVIIAALISLSASSLCAAFITRYRQFPAFIIGIPAILAGTLFMLANPIENQQLTMQVTEPFHGLKLPCAVERIPTTGTVTPTLVVNLNGYGAPVSSLKLFKHHDFITLQTHRGIYHHLACTATLAVPVE